MPLVKVEDQAVPVYSLIRMRDALPGNKTRHV